MASGVAPYRTPGLAAVTGQPRYQELARRYSPVVAEAGTCACHVHVGVPSRDLGVQVLARLRPWLAPLLAVTANSPIAGGHDTGWASWRYAIQSRWPTAAPPAVWPDAAAYDTAVRRLIARGAALDERSVYFLARLSPRYPTVEVRVADVCLDAGTAVLLAGLTRALVATALAEARRGTPVAAPPAGRSPRPWPPRRGTGCLLADPALIRTEIARRLEQARTSNPVTRQRTQIELALAKAGTSITAMVEAFSEQLITIDELRAKMPQLRAREASLRGQPGALDAQAADRDAYLKLADDLEGFLAQLRGSAATASTEQRRRVLRLLVKDVLIGQEKITIRHRIPVRERTASGGGHHDTTDTEGDMRQSYPLCWGRDFPGLRVQVPPRTPKPGNFP